MELDMILIFLVTLFLEHLFWKYGGFGFWIKDNNKPKIRKVLSAGGFIVIIIISIYYFYIDTKTTIALALSLVIAVFIGLYDDFKVIRKWQKVPIMAIASLPIVISYFIYGNLWEPRILWWNFGVLYWVLIVPVVVAGFANGGNVLGGYDGMEVGIYVTISALYLFIAIFMRESIIIAISGALFASLLAMLVFNGYPSKIIFGNSGSFAVSALLGIIPLIGHFEIVLPIVFAPHLLEVFLQIKYTRKYHYDVFGDVDENGIIHNKYGKNMSIIHWIISWGNMTEKKITLAMVGMEALLCAAAFVLFFIMYMM